MAKKSKRGHLKFKVLIERDKYGFFVADIPALQGCHTQAKNIKELMKRVKEVINMCLEDETPIIKKVDIKEVEIPYEGPKLLA